MNPSLSLRPARRYGASLADLLLARSMPRSHAAVGHPIRQEERESDDRGLAIIELITGYGLYVLVGAIAIALAAGIYLSLGANKMISDIRLVAGSVQKLHANMNNYVGLTSEIMIRTGTVPPELIDGTDIRIEGAAGSVYTVVLGAGGGLNSNIGAGSPRNFTLIVQNVDDVDDCIGLASAEYPRLKGVQLSTTQGATAAVAAADPGTAWTASGISWGTPVAGDMQPLQDRNIPNIATWCNAALGGGGAQVAVLYGFR